MKNNFKPKSKSAASANPFDVYQMVTDKILKQIEETGRLPWTKPWKSAGLSGNGVFPMNGKTKRRYEGVNFFLLQFSGFTSPYWLSFKQVEELKGTIRKGEKATQIVFWKINKYDEKDETTGEIKQKQVPLLRYYNVFNVEQCEGLNLPVEAIAEPTEPQNDNTPIELSESVIDQYGRLQPALTIQVSESNEAYYQPGRDLVNMPVINQFESSEAFYSVFFHELAHSTGHKDRLNRKEVVEGSVFGSGGYGQEELCAELTAAFICAEVGINNETTETRSASYIKNWMQTIKADKKLFIMAAGRASKAANYILNKDAAIEEEVN
jgi:antirestriction protein ArdC